MLELTCEFVLRNIYNGTEENVSLLYELCDYDVIDAILWDYFYLDSKNCSFEPNEEILKECESDLDFDIDDFSIIESSSNFDEDDLDVYGFIERLYLSDSFEMIEDLKICNTKNSIKWNLAEIISRVVRKYEDK